MLGSSLAVTRLPSSPSTSPFLVRGSLSAPPVALPSRLLVLCLSLFGFGFLGGFLTSSFLSALSAALSLSGVFLCCLGFPPCAGILLCLLHYFLFPCGVFHSRCFVYCLDAYYRGLLLPFVVVFHSLPGPFGSFNPSRALRWVFAVASSLCNCLRLGCASLLIRRLSCGSSFAFLVMVRSPSQFLGGFRLSSPDRSPLCSISRL